MIIARFFSLTKFGVCFFLYKQSSIIDFFDDCFFEILSVGSYGLFSFFFEMHSKTYRQYVL